ncbi:MAG TPA: FIVAR domain-containing protein [Candidatus Mediterraneibacter stercorigallinarum]|uniref:FIVAR domain-containing protein n=1 Tax=Candidatus Mediterraneibacter stercorigallinarum TaxID=2838686 RepID=A0A9D2DAY7_9FIRM|nr:FIVAR domain-containing protein [Candidatus Mediterraneibacter stercorigallinarum]
MFADAIAKGEAVMADEDATRDEVLDAAKDLMFAVHALEMKAADKTDLEMALELADMIDLDKYVEAGQAEFLAAKETAEAVMADGDAMQPETNEAWEALVEAINALRLKADKSVLEDLISQVEDLDLSGYTEESAAIFRAALEAANSVLADATLSDKDQAKVDDAVKTLRAAYDGLEKAQGTKPENPGGSGDNQGAASGNDNNSSSQKGQGTGAGTSADKAAKTGDNTPIAAACAGLVLASGAVLVILRRRSAK